MRFVKPDPSLLSVILRADHIAEAVGAPCGHGLGDAGAGEVVVFTKFVRDVSLLHEARARGCVVAFDVIDLLCYPNREQSWFGLIDCVIVPNQRAAMDFRAKFPAATEFPVIPHQWDHRIAGTAPNDFFLAGYVGRGFNLAEQLPTYVEVVEESEEQLRALPRFNCHLQDREPGPAWNWKPATKVAQAAGVGAVIVTRPDCSSVELLGEDYPYYAPGTLTRTLERAKADFGGATWERALQTMARVKSETSREAIAAKFAALEKVTA